MINLNPLYSNPSLTLRVDCLSSNKSRELWCECPAPAWEGNKDSYRRTHSIPRDRPGAGWEALHRVTSEFRSESCTFRTIRMS